MVSSYTENIFEQIDWFNQNQEWNVLEKVNGACSSILLIQKCTRKIMTAKIYLRNIKFLEMRVESMTICIKKVLFEF